jgi:asparagine synthase (glutamine-hydrolysing)
MCGIAGIKLFNNIPSKTENANLISALDKQKHRGPDNTNVRIHGKSILGHNRLSIIDTNERSNQPFIDDSERYSLVFNGEIYNYKEIKINLENKGVIFKTKSDTEVLFQLLIEKREDALYDLRGCFSFAFYDSVEDCMLLARDRMGINPLLYAVLEDRFVFGSELFVFKDLGIEHSLNHAALNDYFQFTYIPAPLTIINSIQKLEAGKFIVLNENKLEVKSYWTPENEQQFKGTYEEAKIKLRKLIEFAVTSQLEADVPVGTFLSGGVDSSIVSALASKTKKDLHTFSVSFGDQKAYDESEYALLVAKHIHSNHHVIRLKEQNFITNFQEILDSFDEPFADSSAIAMWFLAKETKKHLTVALSGDGADELFAGYNRHRAFEKSYKSTKLKIQTLKILSPLLKKLLIKQKPKKYYKIEKFLKLTQLKWPNNYWFLASNIGEDSKNKLLLNRTQNTVMYSSKNSNLNDFLLLDQKFVLSNDMLKKVDMMSMRHSLEVRTPFMDKDLVKFANSLPEEWKLSSKTGKHILKDAFSDLLPEEIFSRAKQGFEVPVFAWIKNSWEELIPNKWFDEVFISDQKIFNYNSILDLKSRFFNNLGNSSQEMWAYLVFQNWFLKQFNHA